MAYKDKYGITSITKGRIDNLDIHWDYEHNPENRSERFPVLFYTPDMEHKDKHDCPIHYHIRLDKEKADIMHKWLTEYLKDIEG